MRVLGIIPARKGSKRVLNKNMRILNGQPLISYTIQAALKSKLLTHTIVSTDSEEIANYSKSIGCDVPFLRPEELAQDKIADKPVLLHAIEWMKKNKNEKYDAVALLRPTTPFKTAELIDSAIQMLNNSTHTAIRSVTKVASVHHPYWMFLKGEKNTAIPFDKENSIDNYYQSQLLPEVFHLNGVVDVIRSEQLTKEGALFPTNFAMMEVSEILSMDIDTETDLAICNYIMSSGLHLKGL